MGQNRLFGLQISRSSIGFLPNDHDIYDLVPNLPPTSPPSLYPRLWDISFCSGRVCTLLSSAGFLKHGSPLMRPESAHALSHLRPLLSLRPSHSKNPRAHARAEHTRFLTYLAPGKSSAGPRKAVLALLCLSPGVILTDLY